MKVTSRTFRNLFFIFSPLTRCDKLAAKAAEAAENDSLQFDPPSNRKVWNHWLANIKYSNCESSNIQPPPFSLSYANCFFFLYIETGAYPGSCGGVTACPSSSVGRSSGRGKGGSPPRPERRRKRGEKPPVASRFPSRGWSSSGRRRTSWTPGSPRRSCPSPTSVGRRR